MPADYTPEISGRATAGSIALGILLGLAVSMGLAIPIAAVLMFAIGMLIGLRSWRLSIVLLVAYFPVSGIAWLALYPNTEPAALAKDFLFVIPAYAGFCGTYLVGHRPFMFRGLPLVPILLLAALVAVEVFNPNVESILVGLVGLKVWLFYIPMAFLGYHLLRSRRDLDRLLNLMCLTAIIPAVVGIGEAVLAYTGHVDVVYRLYGDAAATATQEFASVEVGGAVLHRLPSTFSFVAQYYIFMTVMVAVGYAWWRNAPPGSRSRLFRLGVWLLFLLAVLSSGARGALSFIPLLLVALLVIEGRVGARAFGVLAAFGVGLLVVLGLVGANPARVVGSLAENATIQWDTVILAGAEESSDQFFTGLGTGANTNAARYVADDRSDLFRDVGGAWQESYWAKAVLELGIAGLILSAVILLALFGRGLRVQSRLRDPGLRAVSAAILALMVWNFAYNVKGQYIDLDPLNVYFWLFAGILFRLPALERQGKSDRAPESLDGELVAGAADDGVAEPPAPAREPAYAGS
jgi:hypothetical protein